ncbi:MAG: hypothetical protein WCY43_00610 [Patescibacteria group bacterium]|nr:hypothetical protein [Patescibacteria group bacterium]
MPKLSNKLYRNWIFIVGVLATIAYRIIVVLNHYSPVLVQIAWYIGTVGFVWYFAHRFRIENRRNKTIKEMKLVEKINTNNCLSVEEKKSLTYILESLQTSLAKWNYIIIFIFSALALVYGIYQDFLMNFFK